MLGWRDAVPCFRLAGQGESQHDQVSWLAAAILVRQLEGNAFPQGVEMVHQLGQGAGGAHGRGVGTGGFEQAKYLKLLVVVQSLGVTHHRLPLV
jgi:hypothetical protein